MTTEAHDIESEDDVRTVVLAFYHDIESDPLLGRFFAGLDWDAHLPTMVRFWSAVVFQTGAYRGRPFDPHLRLDGLTRTHFARWVERFDATVRGRFVGPRADAMCARAEQIAGVFQVKLGLWETLA